MKVHSDINSLPAFINAVVTIGTFDGVHAGHQKIIHQLTQEAKKNNGESIVITFDPHPRRILSSSPDNIRLLTTIEERAVLLDKLGLDHLVIVPFSKEFANISAAAYVEDFLLKNFNPHTLIIGYDHRFGKGRSGDFHLLEKYAAEHRFNLVEISQHVLHELKVSSTRIREDLLHGDLQQANELLGYSYFFEGVIIKGDQIGRTLGYPTANLQMKEEEKLVPGNGIYTVFAQIREEASTNWPERIYKGMMSIGIRPTVGGVNRTIEVNLFDFNEDIYDKRMRVFVEEYIRQEEKFASLESLKEKIAEDEIHARNFFETSTRPKELSTLVSH